MFKTLAMLVCFLSIPVVCFIATPWCGLNTLPPRFRSPNKKGMLTTCRSQFFNSDKIDVDTKFKIVGEVFEGLHLGIKEMKAEFKEANKEMKAEFKEANKERSAEFKEAMKELSAENKAEMMKLSAEFKENIKALSAETKEDNGKLTAEIKALNKTFYMVTIIISVFGALLGKAGVFQAIAGLIKF